VELALAEDPQPIYQQVWNEIQERRRRREQSAADEQRAEREEERREEHPHWWRRTWDRLNGKPKFTPATRVQLRVKHHRERLARRQQYVEQKLIEIFGANWRPI
jgi:hypothetical protein